MKKIRAAIVGYGNIGKYVLEALEAAPDFEVAGVVRRNPNDVPDELKAYTVTDSITKLDKVDVAVLATPTRSHTAVNACSHRNCHGQSSLDTFDRFHGNRMSHTHPRAEVCISDTFRHHCFQQGANNRVASRIPSGRNNGNRIMCFGYSIQRTAQVYDTSVDIEAIYRIDT